MFGQLELIQKFDNAKMFVNYEENLLTIQIRSFADDGESNAVIILENDQLKILMLYLSERNDKWI